MPRHSRPEIRDRYDSRAPRVILSQAGLTITATTTDEEIAALTAAALTAMFPTERAHNEIEAVHVRSAAREWRYELRCWSRCT